MTSDLSSYEQKDYRRFVSAHFQFLSGLCKLSNDTVNIAIQQFHSLLFPTDELLSEKKFSTHLNLLLETSKSNALKTFTRLLFLIRSINHGNAFISNYGTNFEYFIPQFLIGMQYANTRPLRYDNNCSCGEYSSCTSEANFTGSKPSEMILIKGLKIGCTPSESFLGSTLECFYNQSCINLIQQYTKMNSTYSLDPLSIRRTRFSMNTTVDELISDLFIEQWKTTLNYSSYFEQCLPLICKYTYIQKYNIFHSLTVLIGLQGGFTIILQWICPKLVTILYKLYQYRKKRTNVVQPISSIETIPIENVNPTSNFELIPTNVTSRYVFSILFILSYIIFLY